MPCWSNRLDLTDLLEVSDLLLRTHVFSLRVAGWSMYPTLCKGDRLTVEPVSRTRLQIGDLLLFQVGPPHGASLVCHRLVALEETRGELQLMTKGDAVTGCGETIRPGQVLGRVVAIRRGGWRRVVSALDMLPIRIGGGGQRLTDWLEQGLGWLQGLRPYRRLMRTIFLRWFAYYVGIPEGRWGVRAYERILRDGSPVIVGHRAYHLLAKVFGVRVGSLRVTASGGGYSIEHLYVRTRYRGLGVASQLLALAATAARKSRAPVLLASVEPGNTAALHLFTKAGFREIGRLRGDQVSLGQDL
jgi:ribosomal protein S18 acetylase RimI-like enzyme